MSKCLSVSESVWGDAWELGRLDAFHSLSRAGSWNTAMEDSCSLSLSWATFAAAVALRTDTHTYMGQKCYVCVLYVYVCMYVCMYT